MNGGPEFDGWQHCCVLQKCLMAPCGDFLIGGV
jgi:hypothetical protein